MRSKTRIGQDPGYCQEEENNRRRRRRCSPAERRRCLKSSPLLLWMVLPSVCASGKNYYLSADHYECALDHVREETDGTSREKIERFLSYRGLEVPRERRGDFIRRYIYPVYALARALFQEDRSCLNTHY